MEIHPFVLDLMQKSPMTPDELAAAIAHHHAVELEDVEAACDAIERDELSDLLGWD